MTKSSKAKKAKKADFNKVKLKVGKKLKKAQNETRVEFKVRKIIVKEQLANKDSSGHITTKKKHTIKELLSRLAHQSAYVRQDGINGLKELIQEHDSKLLLPHLSTLLPRLAFCSLDIDSMIRSSAVKIIEMMIIKMKEEVRIYYDVIVTHLACAMVHMNIGVQGDSLHLMNVLLTHTPSLIARHADTILHNFINLISRKVSNAQNKIVDMTQSLLVSPDNKLTSLKWRLRLLKELGRYLHTILKEKSKSNICLPKSQWERIMIGCEVSVDTRTTQVDQLSILNDPSQFNTFTSAIVPLLFQTWAEVDPRRGGSHLGRSSANELNNEAMETLDCILQILLNLHTISLHRTEDQPHKLKFFIELVAPHFKKSITPGFPFSCQETQILNKKNSNKRKNNSEVSSTTLDCHNLNITVGNVCLKLQKHNESSQPAEQHLVLFIINTLHEEANDGNYSMACLTDVIIELFNTMSSSEAKSVENILSSSLACYRRIHPLKKDRQYLLNIIIEITDIKLKYFWKCTSIEEWVEELISSLSNGQVSENTLKAILLLKQRNSCNISALWRENSCSIRDNIRKSGASLLYNHI